MGGLAHYLEDEGLATTQISLIRLHTEKIEPPRALWVPFELGRPLGPPNQPAFQRRVLRAALELLDAPVGPVLVDFPEDAPHGGANDGEGAGPWACPIDLSGATPSANGPSSLADELEREVAELAGWHALAVDKRGRTTVGSSGLAIEDIIALVVGLLGGRAPKPRGDLNAGTVLKLAGEDLKAYYTEAATAQLGRTGSLASAVEIESWFFKETIAGRTLLELKQALAASSDESLRALAAFVPIPLRQA